MTQTVEYDNINLGPLVNVTAQGEPVYDDADRTSGYVRWTFTASNCCITAEAGDSNAGDHFKRIRERLTQPGKEFTITDWGFGPDLSVNGSGNTIKDVNLGPKPRVINWTPVGNNVAVMFDWQCEIAIPECEGGALTGVSGFNYSMGWSINKKGYTSRTIAGYLEVAVNQENGILSDDADTYRDQIDIPQLEDYERTQEFTLSPDRRRLEFSIVDTQIESPNAYPPGIADISGDQDFARSRRSPSRCNATISLTITPEASQPQALAWQVFRQVVSKRLEAPVAAGQTIILEDLRAKEGLFGDSITFTAQYRFFDIDTWTKMITATGMFTSLGYDWTAWKVSMEEATDVRGLTELQFERQDDAIVNMCQQDLPTVGTGYTKPPKPTTQLTSLTNSKPDPAKSYVHFECSLGEATSLGKAFATEIGPVDSPAEEFDPTATEALISSIDGLESLETVIATAAPGMYWTWKGYCERLGYQVPDVGLDNVDGVELHPVTRRQERRFKGFFAGQPLYSMVWNYLYRVVERPGVVADDRLQKDPQLAQ